MITLHLPDDLAREIGIAQSSKHPGADSLGTLLAAVESQAPGLLRRILEPGGQLRPHLNLFIGERVVRRREAMVALLRDGDEVWLLRAVSGG